MLRQCDRLLPLRVFLEREISKDVQQLVCLAPCRDVQQDDGILKAHASLTAGLG